MSAQQFAMGSVVWVIRQAGLLAIAAEYLPKYTDLGEYSQHATNAPWLA